MSFKTTRINVDSAPSALKLLFQLLLTKPSQNRYEIKDIGVTPSFFRLTLEVLNVLCYLSNL